MYISIYTCKVKGTGSLSFISQSGFSHQITLAKSSMISGKSLNFPSLSFPPLYYEEIKLDLSRSLYMQSFGFFL